MAVPGADTVYDLTILYMSDVTNWCEYLFDIFNPFEVYQQSEEITVFPTHESTIHHIKSSRVQVLIISPKFIETATSQISEITGKNSVVGLLCGVEKEELVKLQDRIPDYVNWHLVDAKDGPRCITSTTLDIVDEMIKIADQQAGDPQAAVANDDVYLPMTGSRGEKPNSTYMRMGGPQEDPYQEMGGTLPTRGSQCIVVPDKVKAGIAEKVVVIFTSSNMVQNYDGSSYKIHIAFERKSADVVARVLNQHTLRFESPADLPGGMYKCTLTHNGIRKATFKLGIQSPAAILSDILSKALNPLNYLCDVLGISPADSNQLDNELHEQCKKYMPQGGFSNLLSVKQPSSGKQGTMFPTALHFAAKFGLPCVCAMLCQWPGADQALRMKNIDGKTPDQMTTDEGVKSFLLGHKERSVAQQQGHGDIGYVSMTKEQQKNQGKGGGGPSSPPDQDNPQNRPAYDFPFPVAIPVNPVSKEADIHRLISGDPDDIYNYYDSWERTDLGSSMVRDGDDDDDDDDTQDYETLDSEASPLPHPDKPPAAPVSGPDERPEPPAVSRKPGQSQSDSRTAGRDPDAKLQSLIDIQNRVKDNEISMDEAVILFREWEESHNHTQSMSTRRGAEDRQSSIQKLFKRKVRPPTVSESVRDQRSQSTFYRPTLGNSRSVPHASSSTANSNFKGAFASQQGGRRLRARSEPVATGFTSLTSKHHKEAALRSVSANSYGISPHAARGRGADISERPERSPTSPGLSSRHAINGTSENSNGPASDPNRSENGSEANPPPRSPRPNAARDPAKRISWRNQPNFSQDYIDRPIPPIPPRITSAAPSNYTRLPGARPVFPPDQRGRTPLPGMVPGGGGVGGGGGGGVDSDAIPEHSEHTAPPSPEGLPERIAPLPPRRSISRSQSPLRHSLRPMLLGHKFVTSMRAGRSSTFSSSESSNDNTRSTLESPRRQSDPSVTSKDGSEPSTPPGDRDPSGRPKRPVPRPRAPPRPR